MRRVVPLAFVLSGVAGLVLQVAWFRLLAMSLGGTLAATTAVLTAFMGGLAAGSWFFGRRVRGHSDPFVTYALLEVGAGVAALLTLPLLAGLDVVYRGLAGVVGEGPQLLGLKLLLAVVVLVPSTFFMGGTLPVLCQGLATRVETAGTRTGGLYALNTWGAVAGTLLAAFVLVPRWGLTFSVLAAAALDLLVAAAILLVARATSGRTAAPAPPASEPPPSSVPGEPVPDGARLLPALLFVVGLAGIAYEVAWTRILAFSFGSGAHAFALMLAVVLAGLASGGFLGGWLADRTGRPLAVVAGSQALVAVAVLYQVWRFPDLPEFLHGLAVQVGDRISFGTLSSLLLLGAVQVLLPATVAMGGALPAAARALMRRDGQGGAVVGRLVAANTLGTIPGALIAAWVLIPAFGAQGALFALAAVNLLVAGTAASLAARGRRRRVAGYATLAALVGLFLVARFGVHPQRVFLGTGLLSVEAAAGAPVRLEESAHGTVSITEIVDSRGRWRSLSIDAVNVAGTSPPLLSCQVLQGHLPLLLHPAPRSVLHVGFGSGGTAAAVASHPGVERIEIAEINPMILRVADEDFRDVNGGVLVDPEVNVTVRLADGRNHLIATRQVYDCILSDSIHPRYRGNGSLYTVEYFEICRARLAPDGLVSTWLPIYGLSRDSLRSIVASMRQVFPRTSVWYLNSTINEFVVVVGRTSDRGIDVARLREAFAQESVRQSLAAVGIARPEQVLDFFIAEGPALDAFVADVRLHHDDHPWVEFESATILDRDASWRGNLRLVVRSRSSVIPLLEGADPAFVASVERHEAATERALAGQLALLGGEPPRTWRPLFREAERLNPDDAEPWEVFGYPEWVRALVTKEAAP